MTRIYRDLIAYPDDTAQPAVKSDKTALLGDVFDITPEKLCAMMEALRRATEQDDWHAHCLAQIEPNHQQAARARALARITGKSERQCIRDIRGETDIFESWPLIAAGVVRYLTLEGAIEAIHAATGTPREDAEALIRRHLGGHRSGGKP